MRNIGDVTAGVAELEHDLELYEHRITDLWVELGTAFDIGTHLVMPLTGELVPVAGEGGVQGKPAGEGVEAAKKTARR